MPCSQLTGYPLHSVSQGRSPLWFWHSKSYFRHVFDGFAFAQLLYPYHTANNHTNDFSALTLTLNTNAINKSTSRRFRKYACTSYLIVQFFVHNPFVSPLTLPIWVLARSGFFNKAYHLNNSYVSISKNLSYLSTLWKRRTHNSCQQCVKKIA